MAGCCSRQMLVMNFPDLAGAVIMIAIPAYNEYCHIVYLAVMHVL